MIRQGQRVLTATVLQRIPPRSRSQQLSSWYSNRLVSSHYRKKQLLPPIFPPMAHTMIRLTAIGELPNIINRHISSHQSPFRDYTIQPLDTKQHQLHNILIESNLWDIGPYAANNEPDPEYLRLFEANVPVDPPKSLDLDDSFAYDSMADDDYLEDDLYDDKPAPVSTPQPAQLIKESGLPATPAVPTITTTTAPKEEDVPSIKPILNKDGWECDPITMKPLEPEPNMCCGNDCPNCVWIQFDDQLYAWKQDQKKKQEGMG